MAPPRHGFSNEQARQFPSCVQLTASHYICDSGCVSCPVGRLNRGDLEADLARELEPGRRGFMDWNVFAKAARETALYPHTFLRFHGRGEPTLHPRFVEMVAFAKQVGVGTVQVFTDGISMHEEKARAVLAAGLDVLEFSVHGHTHTYERLMRNGKYEQVKANIVRFVRLRDELAAPTKVVVSAVEQPEFLPEKEGFRRYWSLRVDEVIFRPFHSWGGRVPCETTAEVTERHPCSQLWTRLTVGPTGKLLFCFNSWDEEESEVAGDLTQPGTTIAGVWQSHFYAAVRDHHLAGDYTLKCCRVCQDWRGSSWGDNSYEALLKKLKATPPEQRAQGYESAI
jgi:hypothetical protein